MWYNELMENDLLKSNQEQMERAKQMFKETENLSNQKNLEEKNKKYNTAIVIISVIIVVLILLSIFLAKGDPITGGAFVGLIIGPIIIYALLPITIVLIIRKGKNKRRQKSSKDSVSSTDNDDISREKNK